MEGGIHTSELCLNPALHECSERLCSAGATALCQSIKSGTERVPHPANSNDRVIKFGRTALSLMSKWNIIHFLILIIISHENWELSFMFKTLVHTFLKCLVFELPLQVLYINLAWRSFNCVQFTRKPEWVGACRPSIPPRVRFWWVSLIEPSWVELWRVWVWVSLKQNI